MALIATTLAYGSNRGTNRTGSVAYTHANVSNGEFTTPISLDGARAVWVTLSTKQAAEYYIPSYVAATTAAPTPSLNMTDDPTLLMRDSTSGVVYPSTAGAGYISGNAMPPALSVKNTVAVDVDIIIHITY